MKSIKADLKNNLFILRYIYKAGKIVFAIVLMDVIVETLMTYIGTNIGLWIFDAVKVVSIQETLLLVVAIYGIYMLIRVVTNWLSLYTFPIAMTRISEYIMNRLVEKSFEIRQIEVEDSVFYDKYSRAISEVNNRPGEVLALTKNILGGLVQLITVTIVVGRMSVKYTVAFVFASLVSTMISVFINEIEYKKYEDSTKINRKLSYVNRVIYQPEYGRILRSNFGYRELLTDMYSDNSDDARKVIKKYHNKLYSLRVLNEIIYVICFCLAPWIIGIVGLYNNTMTVGEITVIMGATSYIPEICNKLFGSIVAIRKQSLYINNLRYVLEYKGKQSQSDKVKKGKKVNGIINANNVSFSYSKREKLVVREVDLEIGEREKIALVGANGAGKSTLACLLCGLYAPTEGYVYLDGKNMDKLCVEDIGERVIMINQNASMFSLSIAENILQRPVRSAEDYELVADALKKVGMYEKINELKNGMDTLVTKEFDNDGINLSGGEIQKLAIARVYVSKATIVIMDEPTSALDAISEREIMELLFELLAERTLVIISHRLSFVTAVDTICYLENGSIVEKGSHEELLARNGGYCKLYKAQADKYMI